VWQWYAVNVSQINYLYISMNIFQFISNKFERDEKILIMIVISFLFIIFVIAMVGEQSELQKKQQGPESQIEPESVETIKYSDLTEKQLQEYFSIYEDPFVITLRKGLNGYLDGTNEGTDDSESLINGFGDNSNLGLAAFSKDYYKSKFVVLHMYHSPVGGKNMYIIFQDKPDKEFWAWVYDNHIEDGSYNRYNLRGFQEFPRTEQEMQVILTTYKEFIEDKKHAL